MGSLRSLSDEVVVLSAVRCGTECEDRTTTLTQEELRVISTETHRASTSMHSTGQPFPLLCTAIQQPSFESPK